MSVTPVNVDNSAVSTQKEVEKEDSKLNPSFFSSAKEKVVCTWNATYSKVSDLLGKVKELVEKVLAAVKNFFAPKIEWVKEKLGFAKKEEPKAEEPALAAKSPIKEEAPVVEAVKANEDAKADKMDQSVSKTTSPSTEQPKDTTKKTGWFW